MTDRTKALQISEEVRKTVKERDAWDDWSCCVLCGAPHGIELAHYIPRSQGGLGIPENLVCLCKECHDDYDKHGNRDEIQSELKEYLCSKYDYWDEGICYYKKS